MQKPKKRTIIMTQTREKKSVCRTPLAVAISLLLVMSSVSVSSAQEVRVNDTDVNVRTGPGTDYQVLGTAPDIVFELLGTESDDEGRLWYEVDYSGEIGYVLAQYMNLQDSSNEIEEYKEEMSAEETLEEIEEGEWKEETEEEIEETLDKEETGEEIEGIIQDELSDYDEELLESLFAPGYQNSWSGAIQSEAEFEAQLAQFPASYHAGLRNIHASYPNYRFQADYPGMNFWELVDAEQGKKVSEWAPESYRAMYDDSFGYYENYDWDSGEWSMSEGSFTYASDEVIAHFLDPRNFLNASDIYMFVRQSYSGETSLDDLRSFLEGTFLANGYTPNPHDEDDKRLGGDYAKVLMEAAQISGVSPFVLATTIFTEQGYSGDSPLIQGYYEAEDGTKYISYFNFFNFGATGGTHDDVIVNGLNWAKDAGWTSRYKSILNGSLGYAEGYINNSQDTYYYKNFNVLNGYSDLWHQYASAIANASTSSSVMQSVFQDSPYAALEFRIPVYENMPDTPVPLPDDNAGQNNYYFSDIQADGLEPAFTMSNKNYTLGVNGNTTLKIAVPKWATYEGEKDYQIYPGETNVVLGVRSQTGYLRNYTITVSSSQNCILYIETADAAHLDIAEKETEQKEEQVNEGYLPGDANLDGKISALDYITIKNHIMETTRIKDSKQLNAADRNGDGKVSALDYIAIKNDIMSR